jgi:hypothetical protein
MKYALLNGTPVEAKWAAELPDEAFAGLRTKFSCVDCKSRAYLNKGSPHQAAYFASKNHADDCREAYQGASGSDAALAEANTIVIVVGGRGEASKELHTTIDASPRRRVSLSQGDEISEVPTRRSVDSILQELLANPEFAASSKTIVVGKNETLASQFFVPFLQLGPQHSDRLIGVWGEAFSFRELTSTAFLNRGDGKVDIRIPRSVFAELKKLYHFTSPTQLERASFLLVGTFNFLLECSILDVKHIALRLKDA